jgi:hypothetical protein
MLDGIERKVDWFVHERPYGVVEPALSILDSATNALEALSAESTPVARALNLVATSRTVETTPPVQTEAPIITPVQPVENILTAPDDMPSAEYIEALSKIDAIHAAGGAPPVQIDFEEPKAA